MLHAAACCVMFLSITEGLLPPWFLFPSTQKYAWIFPYFFTVVIYDDSWGNLKEIKTRYRCVDFEQSFPYKSWFIILVFALICSEARRCIALLEDSVGRLLNCLEMVCTSSVEGDYFGWEVQEGVKCAGFLRRVYEEVRLLVHSTLSIVELSNTWTLG